MTQYWYFGVRKKVSIVGADGRTRNVQQTLWSPKVYSNATDAAQAVAKAMTTRPGVSFFIQGFDRKLLIQPDGTSTGFEQVKEGMQ